jgi:hypothetical protein
MNLICSKENNTKPKKQKTKRTATHRWDGRFPSRHPGWVLRPGHPLDLKRLCSSRQRRGNTRCRDPSAWNNRNSEATRSRNSLSHKTLAADPSGELELESSRTQCESRMPRL